jgi:uncharacterized protein
MNLTSVTKTHFILYVNDQARSTAFYAHVLACQPTLDVPGMTEFTLAEQVILGLMPISGIKRLLGDKLPDPAQSAGIPRSEVYLLVNQPLDYHRRAIAAGAVELSGLENRDWGQRAAYSLDPDGHVLAFAEQIEAMSEAK